VRLEVHSKSDCPWCAKAKQFLKQHALAYAVVLHDDDQERQKFYDSLGLVGKERTVPQIVLIEDDDTRLLLGGYRALTISGVASLRALGLAYNSEVAEEVTLRKEALSEEPIFMLRPADQFYVEVVEHWLWLAVLALGDDHPKIASARRRLEQGKAWRAEFGTKLPD
jgi:glutaredoxin